GVERFRDCCRTLSAKAVAANELVQIRADNWERRWPHDVRLALRIVLLQVHELRRCDLICGELIAWRELVDVESAIELGGIDQAVPPVSAPRSTNRTARATITLGRRGSSVDRSAVEVCQVVWVIRVCEVDDIHTALVPALR